jgi:hypothetical protein
MARVVALLSLALTLVALRAAPMVAAQPSFGQLYYEGSVVRTLVPPSSTPNQGRDPLYVVANGVAEQLGIAAVAPGDAGYDGGHWKVYQVVFQVDPYLLTSAQAVEAAEDQGDVTITRQASADFRCPIQP